MREIDFISQKKGLEKKLEVYKKSINKEYTKIANEYLRENSPVLQGKVYELKENGRKRRGFSRFVVYKTEATFLCESIMIHACGWWLDKNDTPSVWDTMCVSGVGNPAKFELSKNQSQKPHPNAGKN